MVLNQQIVNWIDLQSTERFTILKYKKQIISAWLPLKVKRIFFLYYWINVFQSNADIVIYNEKQ